jgi:putative membrane protein
MTITSYLLSSWQWEPSIIIGCIGLIVAYLLIVRSRITKKSIFYFLGVIILFLALVSPLDAISDTYLFSAHMVQHLFFILVVPPFMLLGIPEWVFRKGMKWSVFRKTEHILSKPLVAWSAGAGAMWIWHWPPLFNAALANETFHAFEHLSILVMGTIFWWVVIAPFKEERMNPLYLIFYLFSACIACTILGIIITFSSVGLFPAYLNPQDAAGILPIIRNEWGFSPGVDQQVGGLLMWVPACLVYVSAVIGTLIRWYRTPERDILTLRAMIGINQTAVTPEIKESKAKRTEKNHA